MIKSIKLKKNNGYLILALFVFVVSSAMIFYHGFPLQIPHSYKDLEQKRYNADAVINEYNQVIQQIPTLESKLKEVTAKAEKSNKKYYELLSKFNVGNWPLHIPSVIVLLEQNASYFGLDITLYHGEVKEYTLAKAPAPPADAPAPPADAPAPSADAPATPQETDISRLLKHFNISPVPGMKSYVFPIRVTGDFRSVREYLYFLDDVDFIEPVVVEIVSTGKTVNAMILLHVFSFEGGSIQ